MKNLTLDQMHFVGGGGDFEPVLSKGAAAGLFGVGVGLFVAGVGILASNCAAGCFCLGGHPSALAGYLNGVMCGGRNGCFLSAYTGRIMLSGPACYMLNTVAVPLGLILGGLGVAVAGWFTICREPTAEEIWGR